MEALYMEALYMEALYIVPSLKCFTSNYDELAIVRTSLLW